MDLYKPKPLTSQLAAAVAREWIDNAIEKPSKPYAWSQMRVLMDQLGDRCIAESLRLGEDEERLCARLTSAHDIIQSAWYASAPDHATHWPSDNEIEQSNEEKEKIEKYRHTLWRRHDPKRSFAEGTRSEHYAAIDKDSLASTIADYLNLPYLQHPVLDWIFLDMTISREICGYGESIKENWLPGKRDTLLGIHSRYIKSNGNLAEMTKIDWNETFELWNMWFWSSFAFPIGAIWAAFHWNYESTGYWMLGIYSTIVTVFIGIKLIQFLLRLVGRIIGKVDPRTRVFALWDQMYAVWVRLEGPVVNPKLVRDAMVASTNQGAVWDTISWSLVDRAIAIDSAVWVVQFSRT